MTVQELLAAYTAKAQQAGSEYSLPTGSDDSENSLAFGREMAYKDVVSAIERHLRGDFPVEKVEEILQDIAGSENQSTRYSQQKREIYQQAL